MTDDPRHAPHPTADRRHARLGCGYRPQARLIGREHPAAVLSEAIDRTVHSHGGLVLVAGEAGIGKTTLITGVLEEARRQDAVVLNGSCWDAENAPGYWPWVQVIRALRRVTTTRQWAAADEAAGGRLSMLLGERRDREGVPTFELYDAVTSGLVSVTQHQPAMLVLEDLHWADVASLDMLEFVARHTWFERLLVLGTYRDVEVESDGHPLRSRMSSLTGRATTVPLNGLATVEVGALMARTAGCEPEPGLVTEVHRRTGGNPFFVEETARLWRAGGSITAMTPRIRDALRHRLSLLPESLGRLLTEAAVLGREFDHRVLAATAEVPLARVDRMLDEAVAARLVWAQGTGWFSFAHDLVRETLYAELDERDAALRHATVVWVLDANPVLSRSSAELARHARLAGDALEPARVVDLLVAAAQDAAARLAFDEEIGHLRSAFDRAMVDPRRRALIGLDLGVGLSMLGDRSAAWRVLRETVRLAQELDEDHLLVRTALLLCRIGGLDEERHLTRRLLLTAHGRVVEGVTAEAPRPAITGTVERGKEVIGPDGANTNRSCREEYGRNETRTAEHGADVPDVTGAPDWDSDPEVFARELATMAVLLARREQDDEALSAILSAQHDQLWGPGTGAERAAVLEELVEVARRSGESELVWFSSSLLWVALLEQGDPRYLDAFHAFVRVTKREGRQRCQMAAAVDGCVIASTQGRFAEAEELLDQAVATGDQHERQHQHFGLMMLLLRWSLLLEQGRLEELMELHWSVRERADPLLRLIEGATAVERGDLSLACRVHAELAGRQGEIAWSIHTLWLRFQAELAAETGDPQRCAAARRALRPYADDWLVPMYGCVVSGPAVFWLARLDAAEERWDAAVDGFATAVEQADRMRAAAWSVRIRAHLGEALLGRGTPEDGAEAALLLKTAEADADRIGMRALAQRVRSARKVAAAPESVRAVAHEGAREIEQRLPEQLGVTGSAVRTDSVDSSGTCAPYGRERSVLASSVGAARSNRTRGLAEFRREGAVWSLCFNGRTVHVPDAKGLRDMHTLLAAPGTDIPAVRLLDPAGGDVLAASRTFGGDPILDQEAKARYARRLRELDAEIRRLTDLGDDARAVEYDQERKELLDELRRASGLGGRSRRLGDEAERARKTVTARIRDALRKLDERHPDLAAHLRASISTGAACRYAATQGVEWRL